MTSDGTCTLPDGRRLTYRRTGIPTGAPILFLHGTPGSRLTLAEDDPVAHALDVQLVTPDRPGFGGSDFDPHRTLATTARDLATLADHLGWKRFAVAGVSGGGPHAAACAHALADRVVACALVSTSAPIDLPGATDGMAIGNRLGLFLARRAPGLLRRVMSLQARQLSANPDAYLDAVARSLGPADRAILATHRAAFTEDLCEAFRSGEAGAAHEATLLARPWGFSLAELHRQVDVWHGAEDTLAPAAAAERLAKAIPGATFHRLDGTGHLVCEQPGAWGAILGRLATAMRTAG